MIVGSLMIHSFTAYFPLLQAQFGWSRTLLSGAFALSRAESGILGPLQGWLIDRFGPRVMVRGGMVLFGAGFIMFSYTDSVLDYYLTFLLMALGSSIAGFLTVATTVVNWFERRRGVAMGIAMSGFGIGGLLVPAVAWSLTTLGWRPTAFISGVFIIMSRVSHSPAVSPEAGAVRVPAGWRYQSLVPAQAETIRGSPRNATQRP